MSEQTVTNNAINRTTSIAWVSVFTKFLIVLVAIAALVVMYEISTNRVTTPEIPEGATVFEGTFSDFDNDGDMDFIYKATVLLNCEGSLCEQPAASEPAASEPAPTPMVYPEIPDG